MLAALLLTVFIFFVWPSWLAQKLRKRILDFIALHALTRKARNVVFIASFYVVIVLLPQCVSFAESKELLVRNIGKQLVGIAFSLGVYAQEIFMPRALVFVNWLRGYFRFLLG